MGFFGSPLHFYFHFMEKSIILGETSETKSDSTVICFRKWFEWDKAGQGEVSGQHEPETHADGETWQTCLRGSVSVHAIAVSRDSPTRGYALSPDTRDMLSLSQSFPLSSSPCSLLLLTLAVSQCFLSYSLCLSSDWNQCTHAYKHTHATLAPAH